MEKLSLQEELDLILARQLISGFIDNKECIDWAISLIQRGYRSENLYILAGLDFNDVWNIDSYFKKTVEDLNIDSDMKKQYLLDFYLIYYVKASVENPNILDETIFLLSGVIYDTSYSRNKYLAFIFLYDELEELTGIKREEFALNEFKLFINELESKQ